jgi:hypothetical protein
MSYRQIAEAPNVNTSISNVRYHLKEARKYEFAQIEESGSPEVIGEVLLNLRELFQEALRNMTQAEAGSLLRLSWRDSAQRSYMNLIKFMQEVGLLPKKADKMELSVRDVRHMSTEEIEREVMQLKQELSNTPLAFLTDKRSVPKLKEPPEPDVMKTIEVDPSGG